MLDNKLNKKQGIYIELDALLDTRLSTIIAVAGEDAALNVLSNGYFTRASDNFVGVIKEEFDLAYANRTKDALINATVTKVLGLVNEFVFAMNKQAVLGPMHAGPKIVLNIYPYVLTEEEINVIIRGLVAATNKSVDIKAVRLSPDNITPVYCKDQFAVMFMYQYDKWFEAQAANFDNARCPELTCIVPSLYFVKEPTKEELVELVNKNMHPLSAMEMLSSVFIGLKLYEVEMFCANVANNLRALRSYKNI